MAVGTGVKVAGALVLAAAVLTGAFAVGSAMRGRVAAGPAPVASATPAVSATPTPTTSPTSGPGLRGWALLQVGDCLADTVSPWTAQSRVVACTDRHTAEVIARPVVGGDAWPGEEQVVGDVSLGCAQPRLAAIEGLETAFSWPTEAEWAAGDRAGLCLAVLPAGTTMRLAA